MRVKILTNIAGTPAYHVGEIVDLEPRIAQAWIEEGYARPVATVTVERATQTDDRFETRETR